MRRMALVVGAILLLAVSRRPQAQQPAAFSPADLVGTWTLDSAEPGDGDGAAARGRGDGALAATRGDGAGRGVRGEGAPVAGRGGGGRGGSLKGLLLFDGAGDAFEMITRSAMQQPAGVQPPLTDQQLRFAMSGGFWGSYKVVHQILAGISFTGGTTLKRPLEMSAAGDEVTIKFPVNPTSRVSRRRHGSRCAD